MSGTAGWACTGRWVGWRAGRQRSGHSACMHGAMYAQKHALAFGSVTDCPSIALLFHHNPAPQLFTFDRHVERPAGGLLASYTACCGRDTHAAHRHIKSFVQPRFTLSPQTVHSFNYRKGRHAVNTGGERVDGPMLRPGQQVGRGLRTGTVSCGDRRAAPHPLHAPVAVALLHGSLHLCAAHVPAFDSSQSCAPLQPCTAVSGCPAICII